MHLVVRPFGHEDVRHIDKDMVMSLPMCPVVAILFLIYFQEEQQYARNLNFYPLNASRVHVYRKDGNVIMERDKFLVALIGRATEVGKLVGVDDNKLGDVDVDLIDDMIITKGDYIARYSLLVTAV